MKVVCAKVNVAIGVLSVNLTMWTRGWYLCSELNRIFTHQISTVFNSLITRPPPLRQRSIVMLVSVCLYVCISQKPYGRASLNFLCASRLCPQFRPLLVVLHYNALCTSGFVDNVMFLHTGCYYIAANAIFGKLDSLASEEVTQYLIKSECYLWLPCLHFVFHLTLTVMLF